MMYFGNYSHHLRGVKEALNVFLIHFNAHIASSNQEASQHYLTSLLSISDLVSRTDIIKRIQWLQMCSRQAR